VDNAYKNRYSLQLWKFRSIATVPVHLMIQYTVQLRSTSELVIVWAAEESPWCKSCQCGAPKRPTVCHAFVTGTVHLAGVCTHTPENKTFAKIFIDRFFFLELAKQKQVAHLLLIASRFVVLLAGWRSVLFVPEK
jgi:hypothetical protein